MKCNKETKTQRKERESERKKDFFEILSVHWDSNRWLCIKIVQEFAGDGASSSSSDCIDGEQLSGCSSWWIVSSSSTLVCCNEELVVDVVVCVDETDDERRWLIIELFVWQLLVFVGNKRWNKSIVCCWWNAAATAAAVAAALLINWLGLDDVDDWIG